jgi:hypothetical protein
MDAVQNLMKRGIKMVLDKCLPDICEYYQIQFERSYSGDYNKDVFNKFIKDCFYFRFGLGALPNRPYAENILAALSLDEILERIAFGELGLAYSIKNKFYELVAVYNLNLDGQLDDLFMKYM